MSIRDTWQAKILCAARGGMATIVPSILAHSESELMMMNLMMVCDPPCWDMSRMSLRTPFLCSVAKVDKRGRVVADVIEREVFEGPMRRKNAVLFHDVEQLRDLLRYTADEAGLDDTERIRFFSAAVKWLAADMRRDPTLSPDDPDSRRLTEGVKPAYSVH